MRLTCLAFAVSDLNRVVSDAPEVLSCEFLYQTAGASTPGWTAGDGLFLSPTLRAAHRPGQPLEVHFPYLSTCPPVSSAPAMPHGAVAYSGLIKPIATDSASILQSLKQGPVGMIVRCTQTLYTPVEGVVAHSTLVIPDCLHGVLAVAGGVSDTGEPHVLVRNSWGLAWGVAGHAWLPATYIDLHALEAFGT
jgi:hypothetical protein